MFVFSQNVLQPYHHYQNFNFINSRRPWPPNSISHLFSARPFLSSWPLFYTRGVLVEILSMCLHTN